MSVQVGQHDIHFHHLIIYVSYLHHSQSIVSVAVYADGTFSLCRIVPQIESVSTQSVSKRDGGVAQLVVVLHRIEPITQLRVVDVQFSSLRGIAIRGRLDGIVEHIERFSSQGDENQQNDSSQNSIKIFHKYDGA